MLLQSETLFEGGPLRLDPQEGRFVWYDGQYALKAVPFHARVLVGLRAAHLADKQQVALIGMTVRTDDVGK
ncbi:MAG TPA: hypothetical protein VI485_26140 [Vicinamibacterales bacterium]|nr:hypothetical protein [Vicinamibacterales bacterium]